MDAGSFLGTLAFALAYYKVPPVKVIDKCVEIAVDMMVPGKGSGESNWMMKQYRDLSQSATRQQKELEIRNELRNWDEQVPWFHAELIVRCAAGVVARGLVLSIYQMIRGNDRQRR
jgi:hypothetical protein